MKLTQRTTATGVTLNDTFIHVVNTGDTSQDPTGSSYKAPLSLLSPLFTGGTGGIGGSGTNNYVAKWTPDGSTLGDSVIQDDGSSIGILSTPISVTTLNIDSSVHRQSIRVNNSYVAPSFNTTFNVGIAASTVGVQDNITGSQANVGLNGYATNHANLNMGVYGKGAGVSDENIGGRFDANGGTANHSVQLVDGTQTPGGGKFLKDTGDGKANWDNITASDVSGVVGGSGTANQVSYFTAVDTLSSTTNLQFDGTNLGVGTVPSPNFKTYVLGSTTYGGLIANTAVLSSGGITNRAFGVYGSSGGAGSVGFNIGVFGSAINNTNINYGVYGEANSSTTGENIALFGNALNSSTANYSAQLKDGTETVGGGKFLRDMGDGKANWANITSADTTGASGSFTSADGKTITVTNGLITSIV